jgi:hypothetical protein
MPSTFYGQNSATLAELLSDPIVQVVMRADHVTEQQLMSLISDTLSKLTVGSQSGSAGRPKPSPGFADYRPGVGMMSSLGVEPRPKARRGKCRKAASMRGRKLLPPHFGN